MADGPCFVNLATGRVSHELMSDAMNQVVFLPFNFQTGRNMITGQENRYKVACCSRCMCFYAISFDDVNALALKGRAKR